MIDWKHKLSSRKFWLAIVGFITPMLYAFGVAEEVVVQISAIIGGLGVLVAFILAEGYVDGKREEGDNKNNWQ